MNALSNQEVIALHDKVETMVKNKFVSLASFAVEEKSYPVYQKSMEVSCDFILILFWSKRVTVCCKERDSSFAERFRKDEQRKGGRVHPKHSNRNLLQIQSKAERIGSAYGR